MSQKRIRKPFIAAGLMGLIAVAGMGPFVVRNLLAAFLMFCTLFGALGITVLASLLIGKGVVRCFDLLVACATSFHLRQQPSVADSFMPRVSKT
jgi:hypothetical protein